jgi:putative flippase GtrA
VYRLTIQRGRSFFELGKYGVVGFLNTFLNLGIFNFLVLFSGQAKGLIVDFFVVIAFVLTVTNSFFWNKFWIFEHKSNQARSEYARFFLVSAVIAFGNTLLIHWWINILGAPTGWDLKVWANLIFLITIPISFLGNYFGYRFLVFKKNK